MSDGKIPLYKWVPYDSMFGPGLLCLHTLGYIGVAGPGGWAIKSREPGLPTVTNADSPSLVASKRHVEGWLRTSGDLSPSHEVDR